jgi:hypothetical protein
MVNRTIDHSRFRLRLFSGIFVVLVTLAVGLLPALTVQAEEASKAERIWIGPDGSPLPFRTYEEVEQFLLTAEVIDMEEIPVGVTDPRRALLEKDGIQARAIFRDVDIFERQISLPNKGVRRNWRDCCMFECAAYELAKMLGLKNIPPVVMRKVKGDKGTLQIWMEQSMMETDRAKNKTKPPNAWKHKMQWQVIRVFDALIYNDDRNAGNVLYDSDWNVWMIDHTRSFARISDLPKPNLIQFCERDLWQALQSLDEEVVKERLKDYLKSGELKSMFKRREKLVAYLEDRIEQHGEKKVLFSFPKPAPTSE